MERTKQPKARIKVPAAYRRHRWLVAIPEKYLEDFRQYLDEQAALRDLAEAAQDLRTGNYVVASSVDEALEKFRAGALGQRP